VADKVEGRGRTKGNMAERNTYRTQSRKTPMTGYRVTSELAHVHQAARKDRDKQFTALLHHVTLDSLRQAYLNLSRTAATGVDGVTWHAYGEDLEVNLQQLLDRVHRGVYRAKASRRVFIAKTDGRQRPLGVASLEDKVLQSAVVSVLNAVYESDFMGFSYGFRPGRSQHNALDAVAVGIYIKKVNWVLDADIRGFFDAIDHECLLRFVEHRIGDKRILRLIRKWLSAGVMEDGRWHASTTGTPQGATASPLLANIYLHYVFDLWAHQWRSRQARGDMIIVRYADDIVVGFQHREEAEQFWQDMAQRLSEFALELHPDKTRLLQFGRYAAQNRIRKGLGKPETFDFLGFTHICGKSRAGQYQIKRQTSRKRLVAKLVQVKEVLMRHRHKSIPEQGTWLRSVVRGYFNYHAVPLNFAALTKFRWEIGRIWRRTLQRRSQKHKMTWARFCRLSERWLPKPRIIHPWPRERLCVSNPR
jgi:RNA-directed DNA polymerase